MIETCAYATEASSDGQEDITWYEDMFRAVIVRVV
jgi:hypothetical protein